MSRVLSIEPVFYQGYGGFGVRLGAVIIDYLFVSLLFKVMRVAFYPAQVSPGLLLLVVVVYLVVTTGVSGQTIGKWALGLKVVNEDGDPPGLFRAMVRTLGYLLSLPFFMGFLWVRVDSEHRGWHDLVAGTRVVLV